MQLVCLADQTHNRGRPPKPVRDDPLHYVPELPPAPVGRWTVRLKAEIVRAVRGGWVPIDEVCRLYSISADEFLAWERDLDRYGIPGLRTTRYQIYRATEKPKSQPSRQLATHHLGITDRVYRVRTRRDLGRVKHGSRS